MAAPAYINTTRVDVMLFLVCCNVVAMECPCDLITLQGRGGGIWCRLKKIFQINK